MAVKHLAEPVEAEVPEPTREQALAEADVV